MTLLLGLAIRSTVILAAGLLFCALLKRRSAALRHRVLAASLLAAAVVTPFSLILPAWHVRLPVGLIDPAPARTSLLLPASSRTVGSSAAAPATTFEAPAPSSTLATIEISVVAIWLAGVVLVGGRLALGLAGVRRLSSRAVPLDDPRWLGARDATTRRYGLRRDVRILRTDARDMVATWGVVRPEVLVPRDACDWSDDRIHVVLCHELAHVRRGDWAVQIGAEALRAVLWFNPLAWVACARLRRESEQACDDEVLSHGVAGRAYANHLLGLARLSRRHRSTSAAALSMAQPSTLERRIVAMLNPRLDRRAPTRRAVAMLGGLLLLVTLPLASLRAGQAGPAPLTGTIYDASGGVLPGVTVSLTDASNASATAVSAASGRFEFALVQPGAYVMEVTLPGFRTLRDAFELRDASDWSRPVMLQVGQLQETVVVSAPRAGSGGARRAATGPIRVGGNVRAPRKEVHVNPVYPAAMQEAGISGVVPVEAIIAADGTVSSVRVLSAQAHPDLAAAAMDAVRQWRFTPTLLNGQPVEVAMTVTVRFDLKE